MNAKRTIEDIFTHPDGTWTRAFLVAWCGTVGAELYVLWRLLA